MNAAFQDYGEEPRIIIDSPLEIHFPYREIHPFSSQGKHSHRIYLMAKLSVDFRFCLPTHIYTRAYVAQMHSVSSSKESYSCVCGYGNAFLKSQTHLYTSIRLTFRGYFGLKSIPKRINRWH